MENKVISRAYDLIQSYVNNKKTISSNYIKFVFGNSVYCIERVSDELILLDDSNIRVFNFGSYPEICKTSDLITGEFKRFLLMGLGYCSIDEVLSFLNKNMSLIITKYSLKEHNDRYNISKRFKP